MAGKITDLTGLSSVATGDKLEIVDVSDLTDGASGSSRHITQANLLGSVLSSLASTLTSTAAELNALDGITATVTELNYTDGVTSAIQTQLDAKAPSTSPILVTPVLGVATATSINKVTITAPASSATLTIANTGSLITSGAYAITLTATGTTGVTLPTSGTLATLAGTETLTNKRVTDRVQSVADAATITPNADTNDCVDITAIAQAFTIANPTGTPTNFQRLRIRIKDNGTARAITFGSGYVAGGVPLPTTTVLSKILILGFEYDTANSLNKWRLIGSAQEQ